MDHSRIDDLTRFVARRTGRRSFATGIIGGLFATVTSGPGLPGTYRAWLADENESPSTRFIKNPGPYVLINGTRIANNWTDLTDGSLLAPINITESGGPPVGSPVWTGTLSSGNASTSTCTNWTSTSGNGVRGDSNATNAAWSNLLVTDCSIPRKLYCFQQS